MLGNMFLVFIKGCTMCSVVCFASSDQTCHVSLPLDLQEKDVGALCWRNTDITPRRVIAVDSN